MCEAREQGIGKKSPPTSEPEQITLPSLSSLSEEMRTGFITLSFSMENNTTDMRLNRHKKDSELAKRPLFRLNPKNTV